MPSAVSRVSAKAQTVIPRVIRAKLGVQPGDRVVFRETDAGIVVEKFVEPEREDGSDPFTEFTEWATPEEDEAWRDLGR